MSFAHIDDFQKFSPDKYQKNSVFETERSMLDTYCLLPGQQQKLHAHDANDKYYIVWQGSAKVTVGNETRQVAPGDLVLARAGEAHQIANDSDSPLIALVIQAPKPF